MGRSDALGVEAVEEACNQGGTQALHALAPCGVLMRCLVKRQMDVVVKGVEARQCVSVATVDGAVRIATSGLEAIAVVTGHTWLSPYCNWEAACTGGASACGSAPGGELGGDGAGLCSWPPANIGPATTGGRLARARLCCSQ